MSNARGKYIVIPGKLPFSFYFSSGVGVSHPIRVKPMFNPEKLIQSKTGTLKLCDDWEYVPGEDDGNVKGQDIKKMKQFFRRYMVLFAAVWDEQLQDSTLQDYFYGRIGFNEMLQDLEFYNNYADELDNINTVEDLEQFCRDNKLVNLYGN